MAFPCNIRIISPTKTYPQNWVNIWQRLETPHLQDSVPIHWKAIATVTHAVSDDLRRRLGKQNRFDTVLFMISSDFGFIIQRIFSLLIYLELLARLTHVMT